MYNFGFSLSYLEVREKYWKSLNFDQCILKCVYLYLCFLWSLLLIYNNLTFHYSNCWVTQSIFYQTNTLNKFRPLLTINGQPQMILRRKVSTKLVRLPRSYCKSILNHKCILSQEYLTTHTLFIFIWSPWQPQFLWIWMQNWFISIKCTWKTLSPTYKGQAPLSDHRRTLQVSGSTKYLWGPRCLALLKWPIPLHPGVVQPPCSEAFISSKGPITKPKKKAKS